jgi:hypothetical protein
MLQNQEIQSIALLFFSILNFMKILFTFMYFYMCYLEINIYA